MRAALILALLSLSASAQDLDREAERPKVERQKQKQQQKAAEESAKLQAVPADDVTYEQVLADPDNVELNHRYARAQARRGDLKGASATLERILLVDPGQSAIRFFYAVVLYRLDNFTEAKRELELLKSQKLSPENAAEVDSYLKTVDKRLMRNHLSGRAGLGFQFDSNRNAAPSSGQRLFLDTPIPLNGASQRRSDTSALFLAGLDYRRDVASGQQLFVSANYYRAEQTLVDTLDLQAYSAQAGAALRLARHSLTPSIVFDHVLLAQSTYLRDRGVDLRYDYTFGRRGSLFADLHHVHQDFVNSPQIPLANERDGLDITMRIGGEYVLTPRMRLGGGYLHEMKSAREEIHEYRRHGLFVNHMWLLGGGTFLLSNVSVNRDEYVDPDPFVSDKYRRDTLLRLTATGGAPLSLVHPALKDLLLTLTYEYYKAFSTIENYEYTNNRVGTMLTYKFDLGF